MTSRGKSSAAASGRSPGSRCPCLPSGGFRTALLPLERACSPAIRRSIGGRLRRSMSDVPLPTDRQILAARGPKNEVDPQRPYACLVEEERTAAGAVEPLATIFLTNRECPLRCTYCDLWKNTTDQRVSAGDMPAQIDFALARLAPARHVKLYNSGNFFDPQAIPREDHRAIADRVRGFQTVIVENHPLFC